MLYGVLVVYQLRRLSCDCEVVGLTPGWVVIR